MTAAALGVPDARAALVSDGDYPGVAVALIRASRSRCLATMFIADLLRPEQPGLLDVVEALADAAWRGVDTRVVIGGSRDSYRIAMTAVTGRAVLLEAGVPARWLTSAPVVCSHAKVLITDDVSLVGSHNWSPGSFSGRQVQDSLAIDSPAMAGVLHTAFEAQWSRAGQP